MFGRLLALAVVVMSVGCGQAVTPSSLAAHESGAAYAGHWQYRYGDSPRETNEWRPWGEKAADGRFTWSSPQHEDAGWQEAGSISDPKGRSGSRYLWLRTWLTGPPLRDATLYIPSVDERCEAFLNGTPMTCFGSLDAATLGEYPGKWPVYLRLGDDYQGKLLVLRIYSPYQSIGLFGQVRLDSRSQLYSEAVRSGLGMVLTAVLLLALGMLLLALFAFRWREDQFLISAVLLLCMGLTLMARTPLRVLWGDMPLAWRITELSSLGLLPGTLCLFVAQRLGTGPAGILSALAAFFFLAFLFSIAGVSAQLVHIESVVWALRYPLLLLGVGLLSTALIELWRGRTDSRILALGLLLALGFAVHDALMWVQFLTLESQRAHYAALSLVSAMSIVWLRRFLLNNKRLDDYSLILQVSFAAADEAHSGQFAEIALGELLRLLSASRALLWLVRSQTERMEFVAGCSLDAGRGRKVPRRRRIRTPRGQDAKLIAAAQTQLRPVLRDRWLRGQDEQDGADTAGVSVMAVPLMIRGQLQGVLYLEAPPERATFTTEDVQILLGLGNQILLTLTTTRAVELQVEGAQVRRQLDEQKGLLAAVARMARGDLQTPVQVSPRSGLLPLASLLESMRKDLQAQIRHLEAGNAEIRKLNEELRWQIEQRSRRLLDLAIQARPPERVGAGAFGPGQTLGENYRILALLGQGASGQVFEIERLTDGRRLAAKILTGRIDVRTMQAFACEAQLLARVRHPNLVDIVDVDVTPEGVLFLVTELVHGIPLNRCREQLGRVDFALPLLSQVAAVLHVIHERGIIHRDIKPANILVENIDDAPFAKLLDFGIAVQSVRSQESAHRPEDGILAGTPMYMAPELANGKEQVQTSADIFSFGVLAYELLSGELPFSNPPILLRMQNVALSTPSLLPLAGDLPLAIQTLLRRCLHEDPRQRPRAQELASQLESAWQQLAHRRLGEPAQVVTQPS